MMKKNHQWSFRVKISIIIQFFFNFKKILILIFFNFWKYLNFEWILQFFRIQLRSWNFYHVFLRSYWIYCNLAACRFPKKKTEIRSTASQIFIHYHCWIALFSEVFKKCYFLHFFTIFWISMIFFAKHPSWMNIAHQFHMIKQHI